MTACIVLSVLFFSTQAAAQTCQLGDVTAPELVITSPIRSESLIQGDISDDVVSVVGTASDTQSTLASLTINGIEAIVAPGGMVEPFSVDTSSRWGLNTIVAVATDACGNSETVVQSYVRSASYFPAAIVPDPAATSPDGFLTQLNAPVIDDHDRGTLDDLASIIENAIPPVSESDIPNPLQAANIPPCNNVLDNWATNTNRMRVRRTSFSMSDIEVSDLTAEPGVLVGTGVVDSFSLGFDVRAYSCAAGILVHVDKTGTVDAVNSQITFDVALSVVNGELFSEVTDFTIDLDLTLTLDCVIQAICNLLVNTIVPDIDAQAEDAAARKVDDAIAGLEVKGFLVNTLVESKTIVPPPPIAITIDLVAELESVVVDTDRVSLASQIQSHPSSRGTSIPLSAPGSIRRDGPLATFDLGPDELGNASRDDMLNQLLWALWYGGGLEIPDLTGEAADQGIVLSEFSHEAGLPQVLMPGGSPGRVEVGKGDTLFTLAGDLADLAPPLTGPLLVSGYWSSLVGGSIEVDEAGKRLAFVPDAAEARVQILTLNLPHLEGALVPLLEERFAALDVLFVTRTFSLVELPRIDSAEVGGSAGFELALANATTDRPDDNALRIKGDLVESAICGDGLILSIETCDDGNTSDADGCSSSCQVEPPYTCTGEASVCVSTCGDAVVDSGEACDDGGLVDGDGCSRTCQLQDTHLFVGTAVGGGEVSLLVDGVVFVEVFTVAGDTAATIAQKVANAINLAAPDFVVAGATGNRLYVTATLSDLVITDPGLLTPVPALGLLGRLGLLGALALGAKFVRRGKRRSAAA